MKVEYIWSIALLLYSSSVCATQFVNPYSFIETEANKKAVIEYIKERVHDDYCRRIDMCDALTLRSMEEENLKAFKALTKVQNKKILDRVISDYCDRIDMCDYVTINSMYQENLSASESELKW